MFSRIVVSLGSIVVPALITLDNSIAQKSQLSLNIGYVSFSISLFVFIVNTLYEILNIDKKYYNYYASYQKIRIEGWNFLGLIGKYQTYEEHTDCWQKFLYRVEKINISNINNDLQLSQIDDSSKGVNLLIPENSTQNNEDQKDQDRKKTIDLESQISTEASNIIYSKH